ncbi:MAG TPA: cytochrome c [Rugosibacter sp.]
MMKVRLMNGRFVGRRVLASVVVSATLALGMVGAGEAADAAPAKVTLSPEVLEKGVALFVKNCIMCHGRGMEHPGTAALTYLYGKGKGALEDRDNLTPDFVRFFVRNGRGLMPGFRAGELNDAELKVLAEYLSAGPHPATPAK